MYLAYIIFVLIKVGNGNQTKDIKSLHFEFTFYREGMTWISWIFVCCLKCNKVYIYFIFVKYYNGLELKLNMKMSEG